MSPHLQLELTPERETDSSCYIRGCAYQLHIIWHWQSKMGEWVCSLHVRVEQSRMFGLLYVTDLHRDLLARHEALPVFSVEWHWIIVNGLEGNPRQH